jgi:hypothetical protein
MVQPGIKVKGQVALFKVNSEKLFAAALKVAVEENKKAVARWLKVVLTYIPTYTGTARGTLKPVARQVKVSLSKFGPAGAKGVLRRAKKKKKITYRGKTFTAGFSAGEKYAQAQFSSVRRGNDIVNTFEYTNNLGYVAYNEQNSQPPGFILPSNPPWRYNIKAVVAWRKHILIEVPKRLPSLMNSVKVTKLKVG